MCGTRRRVALIPFQFSISLSFISVTLAIPFAGLALPLDSFDVLDDVVQQRVGGPADGAHFSIVTLDLSPGYVGSIAVSAA